MTIHPSTCIGFAGSSITAGAGYRATAMTDLPRRYKRTVFTFRNISYNGFATWANLVNFSGLTGSNLVVFDTVNDYPVDMAKVEAFIRRVWAMGGSLVGMVFFFVADRNVNDNVNHPTNQTSITPYLTLLSYYNIPYVNYLADCQGWVNGGLYDLNQLLADTVHPTTLGHKMGYSKLRWHLPFDGGRLPAVLPARLYAASADFERASNIKNGTDYDSRTGAWIDDGDHISSVTPGSTITYSGIFRSFGIFNAALSYANVSVTINGGAPINPLFLYHNGYDVGTWAMHTVVITVLTQCAIDEFWSI